jgi:hypothetical protein
VSENFGKKVKLTKASPTVYLSAGVEIFAVITFTVDPTPYKKKIEPWNA